MSSNSASTKETKMNILELGDVFLSNMWSFLPTESKLLFSGVNKSTRRKLKSNNLDVDCFTVSKELMYSSYDEQSIVVLSRDLEKNSFDEYDDFVSRHPNPKGKNHHRRGDSLFNSDIEQSADKARHEEFGANMGVLASLALGAEGMGGMGMETLVSVSNTQHRHHRKHPSSTQTQTFLGTRDL
mmetsp:Transcript_5474/g.5639  ORF Transcript_5474/g.5639 Transcript_5474/m.5639 type:complete len:184 (-) Transcript_5474:227-778(-)